MFIDGNNKVDSKKLRKYVLDQLIILKQVAQDVCVEHHEFWEKADKFARTKMYGQELDQIITGIQQLTHLPYYIQLWIDTAVDTEERFDFFVLTKAHEMKTGDQPNDYFWAMQIRHDQLMGLVQVLRMLLDEIKVWIIKSPEKLLDEPVFLGLTEVDIEQQVHLEAEKIYKDRI